MTDFDTAQAAANDTASALIDAGIPADDIADAFLTKGLAAWAAATGRQDVAEALLTLWAIERDAA